MKKRIIVLSAVSCLTALCTLTAVVAIKSSGAKLDVVRGEPMLRTLTLNQAPTVVDDKFSVVTESGTVINFECENFTAEGTFGTIEGQGNVKVKYNDKTNDIMFSNLYSISATFEGGYGLFFEFRYYDPVTRYNMSIGETGSITSGEEVKAEDHLVQVADDDYWETFHNEKPNYCGLYTNGGTHTISSLTIKYTC